MPGAAGFPMPGANPAGGQHGEDKDEEGGPAQLAPAIVWLGTAEGKDELTRAANRAHADVLVAFEISIRLAKSKGEENTNAPKIVANTTKIRVSMAKKDELLFTSAALNNVEVLRARDKGLKGDDPVEKEIGRVVEDLDKRFTTAELPAAVTPERALARVQSLVAERPDDPLAVVVETRFYAEKGLLKQEDVLQIAGQALGEEELAELLKNLPGAGAGQMIGGSVGLGGLLDLMHGVNSATGGKSGAAAGKPGGGLGGLVPFGLPIPTSAPAGRPAAASPMPFNPAGNAPAAETAPAAGDMPAAGEAAAPG
jgi:hypothetical protein